LLYRDSLRIKEYRGNISTGNEYNLLRVYTQDHRMLRRRYCSEEPRQRQLHSRSEESIRHHAGTSTENEPDQVISGVASGKFLRFMVISKRIQLDSEKIHAIQEMQPPRNLKKLRGLLGRLVYIRRFILNLSGHCQPFTMLKKKGVSFVWDNACQEAFEEIKQYSHIRLFLQL